MKILSFVFWLVFSFDVIIIPLPSHFVNTFSIFFQSFSFIFQFNFIYCVIYLYFYKNSDFLNGAMPFLRTEKISTDVLLPGK